MKFLCNFKLLLPFCALLFLLSSCSDEVGLEKRKLDPKIDYVESIDLMAQSLSNLMENDNIWKDFVIKNAQRKENGDQVFVYALSKDNVIDGMSFSDALAMYSPIKDRVNADNLFGTELTEAFPTLSIALNGNDVNADMKVFYDFRGDDKYEPKETVFYYVGNTKKKFTFSEVNKKEETYIIVRHNERVVAINDNGYVLSESARRDIETIEGFKEFFYSDASFLGEANNYSYRLKFPILKEVTGDFISNKGSTNKTGCYRDLNTKRDGVSHYSATHDYDGGFNGSGEFRVRYVLTNSSGTEIPYSASKNNVNDTDVNEPFGLHGFNAFHWDESYHGDRLEFVAWEEDGGSGDDRYTGSFSSTIPGVGAITLAFDFARNNDDLIGNTEIDYCLNTAFDDGSWIGLGDASFYMGAIY